MKKFRWKNFIASLLAFCLMISQCAITAQATETETQEVKAGTFAYYKPEGSSEFYEYGDVYEHVEASISLFSEVTLKIEEDGVPLRFDLNQGSIRDCDEVKITLNEDNTELTVYFRGTGALGKYEFSPAVETGTGGYLHYQFSFDIFQSISYPQDSPAFGGSVKALTGPMPEMYTEVDLDSFVITGEKYNQFGLVFYDANGEKIETNRITPIVDSMYPDDTFKLSEKDGYYDIYMLKDIGATTGNIKFLVDHYYLADVSFEISSKPGYDSNKFQGLVWGYYNDHGMVLNEGDVFSDEEYYPVDINVGLQFVDSNDNIIPVENIHPSESVLANFGIGYSPEMNFVSVWIPRNTEYGIHELTFFVGENSEYTATILLPVGSKYTSDDDIRGDYIVKDENNTLYECYFDDYAWVPSFTKLQVQIKSENGGFVPIQGFAEAPITGVIGSVDEADNTILNLEFATTAVWRETYIISLDTAEGVRKLQFRAMELDDYDRDSISTAMAYAYDPAAYNYLGQDLNSTDYPHLMEYYRPGDIVDIIFTDESGNLIDADGIIPLGGIATSLFTVYKVNDNPSRLRIEIADNYIGTGLDWMPVLINGEVKTFYLPVQGREEFTGIAYYLDDNGEYQKLELEGYRWDAPVLKKQVLKFKYNESDAEFISDLRTTMRLEECFGGILKDGSGVYFRPGGTYFLGDGAPTGGIQVLIGDDYYYGLGLNYTTYDVPEDAEYHEGIFMEVNGIPVEECGLEIDTYPRVDFCDENGNLIDPERIIPCTEGITDYVWIKYYRDNESDPRHVFHIEYNAPLGEQIFKFGYIEDDGKISYFEVPVNIVEESGGGYPGPGGDGGDGESGYSIFTDGPYLIVEGYGNVRITAQDLAARMEEEGIDPEEVEGLYIYAWEEGSVLGDGEESILSLFPNVEVLDIYINTLDDYALSGSNSLEYANIGIRHLGDGGFANNKNLSYVHMEMIISSGWGVFAGCPKLKIAANGVYRGCDYANIQFDRSHYDYTGYTYVPANLFSGSDLEYAYIFNINRLEENVFAETNLKQIYFNDGIAQPIGMANIDNAFEGATIGTVGFLGSEEDWNESVQITGDLQYNKFAEKRRVYIETFNAGTLIDYGDWTDYDDNVIGTVYSDGQVVFSGEGAIGEGSIQEINFSNGDVEYYNHSPWSSAKSIVIEEGITSIGTNAFRYMEELEEVIIADGLEIIGENAFAECEYLHMISLPTTLKVIGRDAFANIDKWSENGTYFYYSGTQGEWESIENAGSLPDTAVVNTDYLPFMMEGTLYDVNTGSKIHFYGLNGEHKEIIQPKVGDTIIWEAEPADGYKLNYLFVGDRSVFKNDYYSGSFVVGWNTSVDFSFGETVEEDQEEEIEASGSCGPKVTWRIEGDTLILSGTGATSNYADSDPTFYEYWQSVERIVVEEGITSLGDYLFLGFENVHSVELPSTLTKIGEANFYVFSELKEINIPESVTHIGDYAFVESGLSGYVDIPASVGYIGDAAFCACHNIEGFNIAEGNKKYKYQDGYLLTKDGTTLIKATAESVLDSCGACIIPEGVKTIGTYAFNYIEEMVSVQLPVSLKKIGNGAFSDTGLQTILMHPGVTTIGNYAFSYTPYADYGYLYYTGTEAQFNKIKSKIDSVNLNLTCNFKLIGNLSVTTSDSVAIGKTLKLSKGLEDFYGSFFAVVEGGFNPITLEEIDRTFNVSSSNEDVAEIYLAGVSEDGVAELGYVLKGAGKTQITIISNADESKKLTFTLEVAQRASEVSVKWTGNNTKYDELILIPDAKKDVVSKATITWTGGSAWSSDEYKFVALKDGVEFTLPEGITLNEKTGELKLVKGFDASVLSDDERTFQIMLMADSDPEDDIPYELSFVKSVSIFNKKASEVIILTAEGIDSITPTSEKVILDPIAGMTEVDICGIPCSINEYLTGIVDPYDRYQDVTLTATSNPNFEVSENADGSLHVKMLGNTGSITITAKTMDGSNKSKSITVTAGTMIKGLDITTTLPEVGEDTYVIAKGKSATLAIDLLPSAPTQKKITWMVNPDQAEYLTVSGGKITAKKVCEDPIEVTAYATDGSAVSKTVYVYVTEPVTNVEIYGEGSDTSTKSVEVEIPFDSAAYTLRADAFRTYKDANGEVVKDSDSVFGNVEWSVKGSIAKYVTYNVDGDYFTFSVNKTGTFTVRATATDGSGKYAETKVTVTQLPFGANMTVSGTSGIYYDDYETWLFKGDLKKGITVKPTVKFVAFNPVDAKNSGYKLYLAEGWIDTWEAVADENLVVDAKGKPAKQFKLVSPTETSGKYTLTLVSDKVESVITGVHIQVEPKNSITLETLDIQSAGSAFTNYDDDNRLILDVAIGAKVELKERLNGTLVTKASKDIIKSWSSEWITVSGAKNYLTVPAGTDPGTYEITLTYTDAKDPENTISKSIYINVKEKLNKENIDMVLTNDEFIAGTEYVAGTSLKEFASAINLDAGYIHFMPQIIATGNDSAEYEGAKYSISSSNPKVLGAYVAIGMGGTEFALEPLAPGKATVKVEILDGSNTVQSFNVTVTKVSVPVTGVISSSTTYTVGLYNSMIIDYYLKSTGDIPTKADMEWTVSDESILSIRNLGVDTDNPIIEKIDVKKGITYYQSKGQLRLIPQGKAGKVTVTGKTTDGSNKSIKFTINVAKNTTAYAVNLTAPTTAATGGEMGTVVVPWGKSLKLTASLMPNKAKNAIVNYSIIGVEDKDSNIVTLDSAQLSALGVTINKSGSISTKAPSAKMVNPYVGWVKVTATLNYKDAGGNAIEDSIYVYIDRPVSKMTLMEDGKKVNGITVTKSDIDGEPLQIDMLNTYDVTVEYKGFKDQTTVEAKYGSADNLLWTSSNNALASVDQNGIITVNEFTKAGSVTITATAQDGSGVKFTYKVTIKK